MKQVTSGHSFTLSMSVYHTFKTKVDNHLTEIKQETETENHKLSQVPQSYNSLKYECMSVLCKTKYFTKIGSKLFCLQEKKGNFPLYLLMNGLSIWKLKAYKDMSYGTH